MATMNLIIFLRIWETFLIHALPCPCSFNGDNHIMWLLHSYSLMPSWSTEDVIEMASMHAGYEADQCISTGVS